MRHYNIFSKGDGNDSYEIAKLRGPDRQANARLIAAAPDLLDMCRAILARLDLEAADRGENAEFVCAGLRSGLRAAIDKATRAD